MLVIILFKMNGQTYTLSGTIPHTELKEPPTKKININFPIFSTRHGEELLKALPRYITENVLSFTDWVRVLTDVEQTYGFYLNISTTPNNTAIITICKSCNVNEFDIDTQILVDFVQKHQILGKLFKENKMINCVDIDPFVDNKQISMCSIEVRCIDVFNHIRDLEIQALQERRAGLIKIKF